MIQKTIYNATEGINSENTRITVHGNMATDFLETVAAAAHRWGRYFSTQGSWVVFACCCWFFSRSSMSMGVITEVLIIFRMDEWMDGTFVGSTIKKSRWLAK